MTSWWWIPPKRDFPTVDLRPHLPRRDQNTNTKLRRGSNKLVSTWVYRWEYHLNSGLEGEVVINRSNECNRVDWLS